MPRYLCPLPCLKCCNILWCGSKAGRTGEEGQVCPPGCKPLLRPVGGRDIGSPRPGGSPISAGPGTSAQGGNRRTKIPPVSAAAIVSGSAAGKCHGGAGNPEGIHGLWVGWVLTLLLRLFVCLFVCTLLLIVHLN